LKLFEFFNPAYKGVPIQVTTSAIINGEFADQYSKRGSKL